MRLRIKTNGSSYYRTHVNFKEMKRVTVVGSGNVAEAFAVALAERGMLCEVVGRNEARLEQIATLTGCCITTISKRQSTDLYIIAVSDGAVSEVAQILKTTDSAVVVHCAGSVAMTDTVDGVIYPMQSFTAGRRVNFREVPLFIEGEAEIIREVAEALSDSVTELTSEQRSHLHLAAVFACNFTNAMLTAASETLAPSGVNLAAYRPLVEETIAKAFAPNSTPQKAQTGAARRGDMATQERHLNMLKNDNKKSEIYKLISEYIWETSRKI